MDSFAPLGWFVGSTVLAFFSMWMAVRLIRWAKKGSKGASLLGWGMGLPAAGVNPIPPPQEQIEEVTFDIQGKKSSDSADPDKINRNERGSEGIDGAPIERYTSYPMSGTRPLSTMH